MLKVRYRYDSIGWGALARKTLPISEVSLLSKLLPLTLPNPIFQSFKGFLGIPTRDLAIKIIPAIIPVTYLVFG